MALPLATPSFAGIPDDAVKKIDVYSNLDDGVKNALASKISAFDTDLSGIISKSLKAVKGIGDELHKSGITLTEAKARIQQALGGSRSAISDISERVERGIMGALTGKDVGTGYVRGVSSMYDSVKVVVDSAVRTFSNSDYKSASGIVGFIRDLSGNQLIQTFDLGAQAALVKGVVSEISGWGIPELLDETYGATWNKTTNVWDYKYDDEFRFSVTKSASDSISPSTSLEVIDRLMTHGGEKALIAENPSFPSQLLSGYVIPDGCVQGGPFPLVPNEPYGQQTKSNYAYEGYTLLKILNTLKPNWFYIQRTYATGKSANPFATETVWNLEYLSTASEGAQTVLRTNNDLRDAMLAAPFYRVESGLAMLKNMYPYIVL